MRQFLKCLICLTTAMLLWPALASARSVKYQLNAASYFDEYAGETTWLKEHVDLIDGYGTFAAEHYVPTGIPTEDHYDYSNEQTTNSQGERVNAAPLTEATRKDLLAEFKEDKEDGFRGLFIDDINLGLEFRDGNQNKTSEEPEAKEEALLVEEARKELGSEFIIEVNSQAADIRPRWERKDANAEKIIANLTLLTKEFGWKEEAVGTQAGYEKEYSFDQALHKKGKHMVFEGDYNSPTVDTMEYNMAATLVASDGGDYVSGPAAYSTPPTFWPGFGVSMYEAAEKRTIAPEKGRTVSWSIWGYTGEPYTLSLVDLPGSGEKHWGGLLEEGGTFVSQGWGTIPNEKLTMNSAQGALLHH